MFGLELVVDFFPTLMVVTSSLYSQFLYTHCKVGTFLINRMEGFLFVYNNDGFCFGHYFKCHRSSVQLFCDFFGIFWPKFLK